MSAIDVVRHVLDDGTTHYRNAAGELHRTDGPAIVRSNGTKEWYLNGKLHRIDGPAVMYPDGTEFWYRDGKLHRIDGPAVVLHYGTKKWYLNGKCHREDGPAVVDLTGNCEYWIDGVFIIGKTIEGAYCLEWDSDRRPRLSTDLVVKVMSDKGFGSLEEFGSWLAFVVLGDEAVPVITRVMERGTPVLPVLEEYLCNHEDYAGLPFSWWYPIVESGVN